MKEIKMSKLGAQKLKQGIFELNYQDIEESVRLQAGEWFYLSGISPITYLAFASSLTDSKNLTIYVLIVFKKIPNISESKIAPVVIAQLLKKAFAYRKTLKVTQGRICYGANDSLPGLIVDSYENAVLLQINTMGVFRYREVIKEILNAEFNLPCYLIQNENINTKEVIPSIAKVELPEELHYTENSIHYTLQREVLQKIGHYYDHRENRNRFSQLVKKLDYRYEALDLFSYNGAWAFPLLKNGATSVHCVDQADLSTSLSKTAEQNGFSKQMTFSRSDVFKFLDRTDQERKRYKIICCDPPAFAKNPNQKKNALEGYYKLHLSVLKVASPSSLIAFASCTHYVDLIDFQKTIMQASKSVKRPIKLLDIGIQGFDHPIESLMDRGNYIKYCAYYVE